jgi:mycofactocin precursor
MTRGADRKETDMQKEKHVDGQPQAEAGDTAETRPAAAPDTTADQPIEKLIDEELLVEEVSIDGMCGVY